MQTESISAQKPRIHRGMGNLFRSSFRLSRCRIKTSERTGRKSVAPKRWRLASSSIAVYVSQDITIHAQYTIALMTPAMTIARKIRDLSGRAHITAPNANATQGLRAYHASFEASVIG